MAKTGWADFRYTSIRNLVFDNEEIEKILGFAVFSSRTVRAFKLDDLEDICEDYGQVAYYDGNIPGSPHYFDLDGGHRLFAKKPMLVCGNTASMLSKTRYSKAFKVFGGRTTHFGAFAGCGTAGGAGASGAGGAGGGADCGADNGSGCGCA
jgi:hypothetical protein